MNKNIPGAELTQTLQLPALIACVASHRMQLPAHKAHWQLVVYAATAAEMHAPFGRGPSALLSLLQNLTRKNLCDEQPTKKEDIAVLFFLWEQ